MIARMIQEGFRAGQHVTYSVILEALQYRCAVVVSPDSLRLIVAGMKDSQTVKGLLLEAARATVDPAAIEKSYPDSDGAIQDVLRAFVLTMHETGCCDFTDALETRVIVPSECKEDTIPLPVDRHCKRSSLGVCVAAD